MTEIRLAEPVAVEVVVPVHNEERDLAPSVHRLHDCLDRAFPFSWAITIADNGSTDDTWAVAQVLVAELPRVEAVHLRDKGRGRALRQTWLRSRAEVVAYVDVDLSTDLDALLPLVAPLLSGHSDIAIGTRLSRNARVLRGAQREVVSRAYNLLLHAVLATRFSDAQCGFKAIRTDAAHSLLPLVQDQTWFFDTELLVLAERSGLRIHEVPVDWTDDPDSRVDVVRTALDDLRGVVRVGRGLASGRIPLDHVRARFGRQVTASVSTTVQVLRFSLVGVLSTVAYAVLFLLLRHVTGPQAASFLALLLTAVANTAANRRLTFAVRGPHRRLRHHAQGLLVFGLALALTSGSLAALLAATSGHPGRGAEISVLIGANLAATTLRFLLLRSWVFRRASLPAQPAGAAPRAVALPRPTTEIGTE